MPRVSDYKSGDILKLIKNAFRLFKYVNYPLLGRYVKKYAYRELDHCDPLKVDVAYVRDLIKGAQRCAVGQRVCNVLHNGADRGESVFLDELAEGLVEVGRAEFVDKQTALDSIVRGRQGPIMITRVSGKHQEICRAIARNCVYWNSEKHGLKCIRRKSGGA